jgi:hypothetical protein
VRLTKAVEKFSQQPRINKAASQMLTQALGHYETNRQQKRHKAPAIGGVRLYRVTWKMDPAARLAEKQRHPGATQLPPLDRELLYEFRR